MKKNVKKQISNVEKFFVKHRDKKQVIIFNPIELAVLETAVFNLKTEECIFTDEVIKNTVSKIQIYYDRILDQCFMEN